MADGGPGGWHPALAAATQNEDWPGAPAGLGAVPAGRSAQWPVRPGLRVRRTCSLLEFGARGDSVTDDTAVVQRAIGSCSTVVFNEGGRFLVGSVMLNHSNLHLHFEGNASAILKPRDPEAGFIAWCSGCVYENITVTGTSRYTSVIDGNGRYWWSVHPKPAHKPKLLVLHNVRRAHVSGMLFRDSPSFHLLMRGDRMSITGCRVEAGMDNCEGYGPQPNTDAFHTHGTNIYISDCWVHNGDDGFPVEPAGYGEDTRNVLIENCHAECGSNGVVLLVGSGTMSVRDVIARNITTNRTNQGAGIKISEPYESVHGNVTNASWDGVSITDPRAAALYVNVFQEDAQMNKPYGCTMPNASALAAKQHWMSAHDVHFRRIALQYTNPRAGATATTLAGCFDCAPQTPCDIAVEDSDVSGRFMCRNVRGRSLARLCANQTRQI